MVSGEPWLVPCHQSCSVQNMWKYLNRKITKLYQFITENQNCIISLFQGSSNLQHIELLITNPCIYERKGQTQTHDCDGISRVLWCSPGICKLSSLEMVDLSDKNTWQQHYTSALVWPNAGLWVMNYTYILQDKTHHFTIM